MKYIVVFLVIFTFLSCLSNGDWIPFDGTNIEGYPGNKWSKITQPENFGWSSEKLAKARNFSKNINSAAVIIVDNGVVIDAWGDLEKTYHCHSIRKSLLSALIGIHVENNNIDLSKTLEELGIDDYEPSLTPEEKQATVYDLIRARSGIYHPALGEGYFMAPMRPDRHTHAPGTFWYYNNWDFNALGTIFEKESGTKIFEEFDKRIAKPLQMQDFNIRECRYQTSKDYGQRRISAHRYYGFRMSTRDLARFGLLYLRNGKWQDQQIISKEWVQESTESHSQIWPDGGYGYMWWTGIRGGLIANVNVENHCYMASGAGVNKLIVLTLSQFSCCPSCRYFPRVADPAAKSGRPSAEVILDAAGEKDIGEDPSIEAAKGELLTYDQLRKI